MKTDDLIKLMAQDAPVLGRRVVAFAPVAVVEGTVLAVDIAPVGLDQIAV